MVGDRGGVNRHRHRRGRRAGRLVQARRRLAIDAEHQRCLDYNRALIPLGPGLASGMEASPAAQTRADRPGLTADSCQEDPGSGSSRRVEGHPSRPPPGGGRQPAPPDQQQPTDGRCLVRPPRLTLRQTREATRRRAAGTAAGEGTGTATSGTLRLGHLNVRSLTAHIDEVNELLIAEHLDVLCLSETWLTDNIDSRLLNFPGYILYRRIALHLKLEEVLPSFAAALSKQ